MVYFAWFVIIFTVLQLFIALTNLIFSSKLKKEDLGVRELVSVLIPARNEEKNIANILNDLLHQDYHEIEVIVFNDHSSDRTAEIVSLIAETDKRIRLINSDNLPPGWLGKNWACHSLSGLAKGKYLLFIDADVRVNNGIIVNAVSYLNRHSLSMFSIFPKQVIETFGEKITVPNMNFILLSLLPLILVKKIGIPSLSAANGQFMFFRSGIYKSLLPHGEMKNNLVEDIAIARYFKKERHKIACLTGDNTIQCRMYNNFNEAVNGFSKNVSAFFGNSLILAMFFWLVTTFGWLAVLIHFDMSVFIAYLSVYLITRVLVSFVSEQNVFENILFIIPQQFSFGMFIYYAAVNKIYNVHTWKDREIKL